MDAAKFAPYLRQVALEMQQRENAKPVKDAPVTKRDPRTIRKNALDRVLEER